MKKFIRLVGRFLARLSVELLSLVVLFLCLAALPFAAMVIAIDQVAQLGIITLETRNYFRDLFRRKRADREPATLPVYELRGEGDEKHSDPPLELREQLN